MAASNAALFWKTLLIDSVGFVSVVWPIPVALLLVGTPIVIAVALGITLMRWMLLP